MRALRSLFAKKAGSSLEARLGYVFRDKALLEQALTHPSWRGAHPGEPDNQRLEFLGDAVLELLVTDVLFAARPDSPEGELTNVRASLVCSQSLADKARGLGVGAALRLDKGAALSGGADNRHNLEDAMESLIGAVYLDGGLEAARDLVHRLFAAEFADLPSIGNAEENPRSALQEWSQRTFHCEPAYATRTLRAEPPLFEATVTVGGKSAAGRASSKRSAQAAAAAAWLAAHRKPGEH